MRLFAAFLVACAPPTPTPVPPTPVEPPAGLVHWVTGDPSDADVQPTGPGMILMGGGVEPDAAFHWWVDLLSGGDVVVLRASGSDGYNDYLFEDIGGIDSVETLLLDDRALADDPYVLQQLASAEALFIAGGDQADQLAAWQGTGVERALEDVLVRGGVLGGTSAGLAILSDRAFAAREGTITSDQALADPFHARMSFEDDFLDVPWLDGTVTDSHFAERDRLGRLAAFVARSVQDGLGSAFTGLGLDESTALVVGPDGEGRVVGDGRLHVVHRVGLPERCEAGEPLSVDLQYISYGNGGRVTLPVVGPPDGSSPLTVVDGVLTAL